jgi:hypothetical protein
MNNEFKCAAPDLCDGGEYCPCWCRNAQVQCSSMPGAVDPVNAPSPARKGFLRRVASALLAWLTAPCN